METARKALESMKPGTVKILWDFIVIRRGDRYIVGSDAVRIHDEGVSIDEAAQILARK